ncbi:hypothetical protein N9Z91_06905 [Akkermansiaceae bacterium]|nr:hypothetical protein [Akkermansiaceae bacterium]
MPVSSDAFSTLTVSYSLSDTTPLVGLNNLIADPLFVDATDLNFQLLLESPAKDSGDPAIIISDLKLAKKTGGKSDYKA